MTEAKKSAVNLAVELLEAISFAAHAERITLQEVRYMTDVCTSLITRRAAGDVHDSDRTFATNHLHALKRRNGYYTFEHNGKVLKGYILRQYIGLNNAENEVIVQRRGQYRKTYLVHNYALKVDKNTAWKSK